ncbi:MAG: ribonuclease J, partial [Parcubacteria group bacterium]|nr:ribonuclease J [Parcubacteria group bacterium]
QFPEEDMPGIDYVIPNIAYLKGKENFIRGVIVTHGHFDHIGAIHHIMKKIGNPTIFTAKLTRAFIEKRQEEYKDKGKLNIYTVDSSDVLQLGTFKVEFFRVNHTIPDGLGVAIHTPYGTIVHTGDFKFDPTPIGDEPVDMAKIARLGDQNVLALCSDSTGADRPGHSISEKTIKENLKEAFKQTDGRIIISTFSSLITRIQQIFQIAEETGRKIAIDGFSMKTNVEIARKLGNLKIKKGLLVSTKEIKNVPDNKVIILCTGAQGEERAILMRIANGEHKDLRIEAGDTIIFSSSVVPGNERTVQRLKDTITRRGAKIFHYQMMDIHAGGHGYQEDLKTMMGLAKPKYFIPVHGNRYMLKIHGDLAQSTGIPEKNIFIADNGQIMEFDENKGELTKRKVPTDHIMVDGLGVGDVSNIVLRDRKMLAGDGMFVIIVTIDNKGRLVQNPDLISRGFIYMKEQKGLVEQTRKKVRQIVEGQDSKSLANYAYIKNKLRDEIGQFLYKKTERRPMVLPVVIEV